MYHLTTHAFFKALLFLGAGSVIHALHTQDIWQMGKLLKKLPTTSITFLIGSLALCGIFPLSGFWSKDEILLEAFEKNMILYYIASLTSWMTCFYMARACFVAFLGPSRREHEPHESPWVMQAPLIFLALGSVFAGFIGIPAFLEGHQSHEGAHINWNIAMISQIVALLGIGLAFILYTGKGVWWAAQLKRIFGIFHLILIRKYYMDDLYQWIVKNIQQTIAILCNLFDRYIIIRFAVNGTARITRTAGEIVRFCQTGRVQTYALLFFAGITTIVFIFILK
jgi:NADH-quinone oxidoreductase subunit L